MLENPPAIRETTGSITGSGRCPGEAGMVTHSSILAWRIPWTEEPGGLHQSIELQRVGHSWETDTLTFWWCGVKGGRHRTLILAPCSSKVVVGFFYLFVFLGPRICPSDTRSITHAVIFSPIQFLWVLLLEERCVQCIAALQRSVPGPRPVPEGGLASAPYLMLYEYAKGRKGHEMSLDADWKLVAPLEADGITVAVASGFVECEKGKGKNLWHSTWAIPCRSVIPETQFRKRWLVSILTTFFLNK